MLKFISKKLAAFCCAVALAATFSIPAFASSVKRASGIAPNTAVNRSFSFGINIYNNSHTTTEKKDDATSAWIKASDGHFYVTVYGSTGVGQPLSDETYGGYVTVSDTSAHYLPNMVHENGFGYCTLGLRASEAIANGWASGYWSPDSV
ncbi:MAG: hypothetical protein LKJ17_12585 [Oscillospiraceae bacterium]|nr:hypothetical protein [Oscillospiraceae bacterium]